VLLRGAAPQADGLTLWIKRVGPDVQQGAEYSAVRGVDPSVDIDELKARWVRDKNVDVDPSLVQLRVVKRGSGKPDATQEGQATLLDDPSVTLREARLAPTTWLLARVASEGAATHKLLADLCIIPGARASTFPRPQRVARSLRALIKLTAAPSPMAQTRRLRYARACCTSLARCPGSQSCSRFLKARLWHPFRWQIRGWRACGRAQSTRTSWLVCSR
jgi:hypothetical protein